MWVVSQWGTRRKMLNRPDQVLQPKLGLPSHTGPACSCPQAQALARPAKAQTFAQPAKAACSSPRTTTTLQHVVAR